MNPFKNMMQQAQDLQKKMLEVQKNLENLEVKGSSGGDLVTIMMTGKGDVKRIAIDNSLLQPCEKEVLEDLLVAALRDGRQKADELSSSEMNKLSGGLQLPEGMKLPF